MNRSGELDVPNAPTPKDNRPELGRWEPRTIIDFAGLFSCFMAAAVGFAVMCGVSTLLALNLARELSGGTIYAVPQAAGLGLSLWAIHRAVKLIIALNAKLGGQPSGSRLTATSSKPSLGLWDPEMDRA
jgi:hypothetical protein